MKEKQLAIISFSTRKIFHFNYILDLTNNQVISNSVIFNVCLNSARYSKVQKWVQYFK